MKYQVIIISLLTIFNLSSCKDQFDDNDVDIKLSNESLQKKSVSNQNILSLNNDQRRRFLEYYAPVIFKQADEYDQQHHGYDWITNFDFDNDNFLANNKEHWEDIENYIDQSNYSNWQIRPTLYTSIIEFYDHSLDTKSVILIYHVYHAKQRFSIHDWERIEIRIDNVSGDPGANDEINYVVVTRHSLHNSRQYPHEDLNFMETTNGKHIMIWQADWNIGLIGTAELRFVEESWNKINDKKNDNGSAKVDINGSGKNRFHYIFVNDADPAAINFWNAQQINQQNASSLASKKSQNSTVSMNNVKKIQYELQDIADIIPTHLNTANWKKLRQINLVTPVVDEYGATVIDTGISNFYYKAKDTEDSDEDRNGYIRKHWFWGVYILGEDGDNFYETLDPQPWQQHLYFAHNGTRGDGSVADEISNRGIFLGKGEYSDWINEGGFDGRWVQLFAD